MKIKLISSFAALSLITSCDTTQEQRQAFLNRSLAIAERRDVITKEDAQDFRDIADIGSTLLPPAANTTSGK